MKSIDLIGLALSLVNVLLLSGILAILGMISEYAYSHKEKNEILIKEVENRWP